MTRPPLIMRPTYLDGAPADQAIPALKDAAGQAVDACRRVPGSGLVGATLLGVTAAYFVPKAFDWFFARLALSRDQGDDLADDDGDGGEFDLEIEP